MAIINKRAGHQMCEVREKLGLTMRDVYRLSKQIANSLRNRDYMVSPSRLCDIERKGATPVSSARTITRIRLQGGTVAEVLWE